MGRTGFLIILIFLILIVIPVIIIKGPFWNRQNSSILVKVYNHEIGKIVTMELSSYLRGVVAAEMPAVYDIEALKAQAVAARTYTLKQLPSFGGEGSQEHPGADICTDHNHSQAWLSEKDMKSRWGFLPFFYYWARINRAIEETEGEVLYYNGQLIDAVYHANSGGTTEDASFVWGRETPYLISVPSPYDKESKKNYMHTITFEVEELKAKLGINDIKENEQKDIKIIEKSKSDRVLNVNVFNREFTGKELRNRLALPSTKFDISANNEGIIIFKVYGKGHGVGLSQDGANGYAKHGYDYKEILRHYYPGANIGKIR